MEVRDIIHCVDELEQLFDQQWMDSLDERKRKELQFFDVRRDPGRRDKLASEDPAEYAKFYGNSKYYAGAALCEDYVERWIENHAPGKVFLDYACGNGRDAIRAARAGAALSIGLDISRVSIENAKRSAAGTVNTGNIRFIQGDAENTKLPSSSIDIIVCRGMLHHLDLSYAFPELRRILVPGGKILAYEALDYNPIIKLYRYLTPHMRSEWETSHILDLRDVKFARRFFETGEMRFWHITSILCPYMKSALPLFNAVDRCLTRIPLIRLLAWIFTFELVKPGGR